LFYILFITFNLTLIW